jgi:hypothetical protein|tara:strand:+ start:2291 stop:2896 length:606 start_codon:yes stop_codon:yes gene_type:complete
MASSATPYGLKPVNLIGGQPYAGSTRQIKIASGYGTNIFNGSVVSIVAGGTIEIVTTNGDNSTGFPAGTIGIFVGCRYTDPSTSQLTFNQYWPTGTVASDAMAYIVDDPDVVFQIQADGAVTQADLGQNTHLAAVQSTSTGSTTTGNSTSAATSTTNTTSGWAFRIVDFVDAPGSSIGDAYTDLLVKFNPDSHSYLNKTGI